MIYYLDGITIVPTSINVAYSLVWQFSTSMTRFSFIKSKQICWYLGSSQDPSRTIFAKTLAPYLTSLMSSKQSDMVWTSRFIILIGAGPKSFVIIFSSRDSSQVIALHCAASIYSSSSNPNLHLKYLSVGSNGCINLGNRQPIPSLSYKLIFNRPIFDLTFSYCFAIEFISGFFLFVIRLIFRPKWIIGRRQDESWCVFPYADCLEIDVRGMASSGSVNITAVASTVLGIKNPDSGRSDEYTLNTVAPVIPAVRSVASAATFGVYLN